VTDEGLLVGTALTGTGRTRAFRWRDGRAVELSFDPSRDTGAQATNDAGITVGWVSVEERDRGQLGWRPTVWLGETERPVIVETLPGGWGTALAVNRTGDVLLWIHRRALSLPMLRTAAGDVALLGEKSGRGVIPMALNSAGEVLGFVNDEAGRALALLGNANDEWRRLGTPPGWYPCGLNDLGDVVGSTNVDGYERPSIRYPSGEVVSLPAYAYHHCRPHAVSGRGEVVGTASTDHGSHALLWRRIGTRV
jgi:probable HAF family extracellular repeat protein